MAACQTHDRPIGKEQKNEKTEEVRAVCQDQSCKTSTENAARLANFLNMAKIVVLCSSEHNCCHNYFKGALLHKVGLCVSVTVS